MNIVTIKCTVLYLVHDKKAKLITQFETREVLSGVKNSPQMFFFSKFFLKVCLNPCFIIIWGFVILTNVLFE